MLRNATLRRSMLCVMAACGAPTPPPADYPKVFCGAEQVVTRDITSSHPFVGNVGLDMGTTCWLLDIKESQPGAGGPMTLQRVILDPGGAPVGHCAFSGVSNPVRAQLTAGGCEFPTSGGYARLFIDEPVSFSPKLIGGDQKSSFELGEMLWSDARQVKAGSFSDLTSARGTIRFQVQSERRPGASEPMATVPPAAASASCGAPRCFRADFSGKGTLVAGGETPCRKFVNEFGATPFSMRIDERGFLAFAEKTAQVDPASWNTGLFAPRGCQVESYTGQRGGPIQRYSLTFDGATGVGGVTMVVNALYTDGPVTSLCETTWETTLAPCP